MTDAIKKWMQLEASDFYMSYDAQDKFISGLTKGIELIEGYEKWKRLNRYSLSQTGWWSPADINASFTTSQLLEKYINQLNK
jgi:hypothetical protein